MEAIQTLQIQKLCKVKRQISINWLLVVETRKWSIWSPHLTQKSKNLESKLAPKRLILHSDNYIVRKIQKLKKSPAHNSSSMINDKKPLSEMAITNKSNPRTWFLALDTSKKTKNKQILKRDREKAQYYQKVINEQYIKQRLTMNSKNQGTYYNQWLLVSLKNRLPPTTAKARRLKARNVHSSGKCAIIILASNFDSNRSLSKHFNKNIPSKKAQTRNNLINYHIKSKLPHGLRSNLEEMASFNTTNDANLELNHGKYLKTISCSFK